MFDYFRNNALDARNYFDPSGTAQAPFHNNQYGAALGGPIIKGKTFFYVDYEGQQERVGVVSVADRAGSFVAGGNESGDSEFVGGLSE